MDYVNVSSIMFPRYIIKNIMSKQYSLPDKIEILGVTLSQNYSTLWEGGDA